MDFNFSEKETPIVAYFVSSHGFGHATRSAAIISAIHSLAGSVRFIIFSELSTKFWKKNLSPSIEFTNLQTKTDVGLIQNDPFHFDMEKTIARLDQFLSELNGKRDSIIKKINGLQIKHVVSDISILGIIVGQSINVSCTLVENFTWDWIYEPYCDQNRSFELICSDFKAVYDSVDLRIQATPFCQKLTKAIEVPPIYRKFKNSKEKVKNQLGLDANKDFTIVSTGGIPFQYQFLDSLKQSNELFILCGNFHKIKKSGNLIFLPMDSDLHFPDLINASSRVIGKVGYGTTIECWAAQRKLHGIYRNDFRESKVLKKFIKDEKIGEEILLEDFVSGNWINSIRTPENPKAKTYARNNGDEIAAKEILNQFSF